MKFSIVIPAKNEERNIRSCLESIASVNWPSDDYEVIVVDNGSTDETVEIARSSGASVFVRPGVTVAALRNYGATKGVGDVLVFLDADCTVPPDWFHEAVRYVDREDIVCFGSPPVIPPNSTWVQRAWFHMRKKKIRVGVTEWLESMNMFVRRNAFEGVSGFNSDLITCEDYDLSMRLKNVGTLITDERIVAIHHGEASTVTHFFRKEHWRASSNFRGLLSHRFNWRELPSLIAPSTYLFLATMMLCYMLLGKFTGISFAITIGFWQAPLALFAINKSRESRNPMTALQLLVLLNIYFIARGLAVLRWK